MFAAPNHRYQRGSEGIAIGPILLVIALLGILATIMASDNGSMSNSAREDTITAQLASQANLIRAKLGECEIIRGGWPAGDGSGTLVTALTCPGDPAGQDNIWSGLRPVQLAPPPSGFNAWTYYDYSASAGGRCVKIAPTSPGQTSVRNGIKRAFSKFTNEEADYDSNGAAQSFIIWITRPSGTAGANCVAG